MRSASQTRIRDRCAACRSYSSVLELPPINCTPTTKTKPTSSSTPIFSHNHFGSLLFCSRCSDLLALPGDDDEIVCDACGQVEDAAAYENQTITTRSHSAAFPSSLRQKKTSLVKHTGDVEKKKVYVDEMCENVAMNACRSRRCNSDPPMKEPRVSTLASEVGITRG
ncbi:BQ5605_C007g04525 [Microbotryum silenes-dioicae]|uniref:BQ5605_C007g04525 protein n=1 Tax=Microbotryum silenes-dioicae TaxID=796604 RepID=A0A2X0MBE3_9BASI|nr:BQ5605_C007g04525 [Microbotryum silenes-dioicae]